MIIVVLILLSVIIYYYLNNSLYETFTSISLDDIVNKPEKTQHFVNLKQDKVFKNNVDLDFLKKKESKELIKNMSNTLQNLTPEQKSEIGNILTNQIAPIASKLFDTVKIPTTSNITNRIPDNISNKNNHILPEIDLSKIQDINFKKNVENIENFNNQQLAIDGSKFSGLSSIINHNNKKHVIKQATAIAKVLKGKLFNILIVSPGKGYKTVPNIKIISKCNGYGAKCKAYVKDGSITHIKIISHGSQYQSIPEILIEKPNI